MQLFTRKSAVTLPVRHDTFLKKQVIFGPGQFNSIPQLATVLLPPGQETTVHEHLDMSEVFYVLSGQVQAIVAGKSVEIATGDTLVIEPKEPHVFKNTGGEDATLLYFGVVQG